MRWIIVVTVLLLISLGIGCCLVVDQIGGASSNEPEELPEGMTPGTKAFVDALLEGIDPAKVIDQHVHVVGLGVGGTGCFVNPHMQSWWHPVKRISFEVYADSAGIEDIENADAQYVARLLRLVRQSPAHGKVRILAFDKHYRPDGTADLERTEFHTPNDYVLRLVDEHPDCFVPAVSVHPYRKDAIQELTRCAKRGARVVKWLPNAMGIDPSDERCEPFYRKMVELSMVLLTHTGEEQAVDAGEFQALGNPLLLRKPLDMGVKIIGAHCASLGEDEDIDNPGSEKKRSFELFLRLMDEPRYAKLLYGDISALPHGHHLPDSLATFLGRTDLHHRLLYGSDYPLPAINVVMRTKALVSEGFLTEEEREHLNELYEYNPLLFDFAVKRTIRHPESGAQFPASVFTTNVE